MIQVIPQNKEAYQLLHEGALAFAEIERNGMRIDEAYCRRQDRLLGKEIAQMDRMLCRYEEIKVWKKVYGVKFNIDSDFQLRDIFFKRMGYTAKKETDKGNASVDQEALKQLDIPVVDKIIKRRQLMKMKNTYISNLLRETVNGIMRPSFNLNLVDTYRSCVAKGSLIYTIRDFIKYPNGVPIEQIEKGDQVYCFDNNLNPIIRKVIWAGKTGHKKIIRLHWRGAKGNRGYLDVTPRHLIRHISGEYIQAQNLKGDLRNINESKHTPKIRVLSCNRKNDKLFFTGHNGKNNSGVLEHHFIYTQLNGPLKYKDIIHHEDEIHLNHEPTNLKKMTLSQHSILHNPFTDETRKKSLIIRRENIKQGKTKFKKRKEHHASLNLSKIRCLRLLARNAGQIKYITINEGIDFNTFKKYLKIHNINLKIIKLRYDKKGKYIPKGRLEKLSILGRSKVQKILGHNYYKLIHLYEYYGLDINRNWANQFGEFKIGNHQITEIEYLNKYVDVYDLEVEEYNNFFANEICVHNSSSKINFQNLPVREPEMMNRIRTAFIPRSGHRIGGVDYSGIEVRGACWYHKDPNMLNYINDPKTDMHRDMAMDIFMLKKEQVPTGNKGARYCAKNKFVFPEFYGDWFKSCATSLWDAIDQMDLKVIGCNTPMKEHLRDQGIKNYTKFEKHIEDVEYDFWNNRFPVYTQWKKDWLKAYEVNGYFDSLSGFRYSGVMRKNQVINYPVQGVAFHCLLWALPRLLEWFRKEDLRSKIIGQIHDEITQDNHEDEIDDIMSMSHEIMCNEIRGHWPWIITSLDIEAEFAPVDRPWNEKELYPITQFIPF